MLDLKDPAFHSSVECIFLRPSISSEPLITTITNDRQNLTHVVRVDASLKEIGKPVATQQFSAKRSFTGAVIVPAKIRVETRLEITRRKSNIDLKTKENLVSGRGLDLENFL